MNDSAQQNPPSRFTQNTYTVATGATITDPAVGPTKYVTLKIPQADTTLKVGIRGWDQQQQGTAITINNIFLDPGDLVTLAGNIGDIRIQNSGTSASHINILRAH